MSSGGGEPCDKCGRFKGYVSEVAGGIPVILCMECRRDLHLYLASLPLYRKLATAKYCLAVLAPAYDKKNISRYFARVLDLELELGKITIEWLKIKKEKGKLVSIAKREKDE